MSKQVRNGFSVFQKIIMILLALVIVLMGVVNLLFGKATSAPNFGKYNVFINRSIDMEPEIKQNTAIISDNDSVYTLQAGNVVLCKISEEQVVPLRIYEIQEDVLGNKIYCVRPDKNDKAQTIKLEQGNIIAKCTQTSDELGKILLFIVSGMGKIVFGAIPAVIIMLIVIVHNAFSKTTDDEYDDDEYEDDDEYDDEEDDEEEEKELQRQFSKKIVQRQGVSKPSQSTSHSYSDKTILYNPQEVPLFTPQNIKDTDAFKQKKASISNNFGMNSTVGGSAVAVAEREETQIEQPAMQNAYSEEDVQRTAEAKVAEIKMAIQQQAEGNKVSKQQDMSISTEERKADLYQAVSDKSTSPYLDNNDVIMEQIMQEAKVNNTNHINAVERVPQSQQELRQVNSNIQAVPTVQATVAIANEPQLAEKVKPVQQEVTKKVVRKKVARKPATFEDIMKVLDSEEKKLK